MKQRARYMLVLFAALAGCSGAPSGGVRQASLTPALGRSPVARASAIGDLYVAYDNASGGGLAVYPPGAQTPAHTITNGIDHPTALAVDSFGNIYVANGKANSVGVFTSSHDEGPDRTITTGVSNPRALAIDGFGRLYVGNKDSVSVYDFGKSTPAYTLGSGSTLDLKVLAIDPLDNLYVGDAGGVAVYAAGSSKVLRFLKGLQSTKTMVFDGLGRLFVAMLQNMRYGDVYVYQPGSTDYYRDIYVQKDNPVTGVAVDHGDQLYVAASRSSDGLPSYVGVYSLTDLNRKRTITEGASHPGSMVFDQYDNLYLADLSDNSIHLYTPSEDTPFASLRIAGVPAALAIQPVAP